MGILSVGPTGPHGDIVKRDHDRLAVCNSGFDPQYLHHGEECPEGSELALQADCSGFDSHPLHQGTPYNRALDTQSPQGSAGTCHLGSFGGAPSWYDGLSGFESRRWLQLRAKKGAQLTPPLACPADFPSVRSCTAHTSRISP